MTVRENIIGRPLFEVFPDNPDDPAADGVRNLKASLYRVLEHSKPDRMAVQKYDIRRPEIEGGGFEERYWSPLNTPILAPDGTLQYIVHWVEDVTALVRVKEEMRLGLASRDEELRSRSAEIKAESFLRHEALEANRRLTESERRYRFLADAVPQLVWTADARGGLDYGNERLFAFTGRSFEQLRGDGWHEVIHPDDRARTVGAWWEAVGTGADRFQIEHRMQCHDGAWCWTLTTALPFRDGAGLIQRWYATTTDINARVLADEELRQAQRLQAVGKLAGGVAHEVNNMMTVVLGMGQLVRDSLAQDHPQRRDVEEMMRAGTRAADVTRQLLAFSRQQVLKPVVLSAHTVAHELFGVLQRLLGSDRRLEIPPPVGQVRVLADRGQLEQVLINLVVNARDATQGDGRVVIETGAAHPDREALDRHREPDLEPGRFVRLCVRDDGAGMAPDVAARAFEPFFTTKDVGQGTGLGLSMVHGIVKQSGGYVHIESAPGRGTAVTVYLPQVEDELTETIPMETAPLGRGETVLVVDDEPMVRSAAQRALQAEGYNVYMAPNGASALEFLGAHSGRVALVLTDIVMPYLNGPELAERIAQRHPGLPVLFMSGYSGADITHRGLALEGIPFIQKPFSRPALSTMVRRLLDSRVEAADFTDLHPDGHR